MRFDQFPTCGRQEGSVALTSELTITVDNDADQIVIEGMDTGAAGGAGLLPVEGIEMLFDRFDGRLRRLVIDPGDHDAVQRLELLTTLFGPAAKQLASIAAARKSLARAITPRPDVSAALSRLARLDAARATSPVPASSLWPAEAAVLAEQAGFHDRARAEARKAVAGLTGLLREPPLPAELEGTVRAVATLAEHDEPEFAKNIANGGTDRFSGSVAEWLAVHGGASGGEQIESPMQPSTPYAHLHGVQWLLDPGLVPAGLFAPALMPGSDLDVRPGEDPSMLQVEVRLVPGADMAALEECRVRLVDPAVKRILAVAPLARSGDRARATLQVPFPLSELKETWLEVVDDERRPVRSGALRRLHRALRWADLALRAARRPAGLAPGFGAQDWAATALTGWEHARRNWEFIGDAERAYLAAAHAGVVLPRPRPHRTPSAWAAELAGLPAASENGYLAEALGR
jgi:hypothetical protein